MTETLSTSTLRVLVVEDERRLRTLLAEVIPELGFLVTAVGSAEEAMESMQAEPSQIVLLDLQLPRMSGMELFSQIRRHWPETEVVILTAFGDLETAQRAIRLEVTDFLRKPFHLRDVELAFDRASRRIREAGRQSRLAPPEAPATNASTTTIPNTLDELEYRHIRDALKRHHGNRTAAAEELGISRRTLHYRLAEYRDRGLVVE